MLPLELKREAVRLARSLGISLGELVRSSLEATLRGHRGELREDPLYALDHVYDGPVPADLSADHDAYLYDAESGEDES